MPRVPRYDGPQIKQAPIPGARISPVDSAEAFGAGAGSKATTAALQGLGATALKIVKQERDRADDIAVLSAKNKALRLKTEADMMITNSKGLNALTATEDAQKYYNQETDKIYAGLQKGKQQFEFSKTKIVDNADLYSKGFQWAAQQMEEVDVEETKSGITLTMDAGAAEYGNPVKHEAKLQEALEISIAFAERHGWNEKRIKDANDSITSSYRAKTLNRMMLNEEFEVAAQYEKDYRKEILEPDMNTVNSVRAKAAAAATKKQSDMESEYTRLAATGEIAGWQIRDDFEGGQIDKTLYTAATNAASARYDDPAMREEDKLHARLSLMKSAMDIGVEFESDEEEPNPLLKRAVAQSTEASFTAVRKLREDATTLAPWISRDLLSDILVFTQANYDAKGPLPDLPAKKAVFQGFLEFMEKYTGPIPSDTTFIQSLGKTLTPEPTPYGSMPRPFARFLNKTMDDAFKIIFHPKTALAEARRVSQEKEDEIKKNLNPLYKKYKLNEFIETHSGSVQMIGEANDGTPIVKVP